jgi:hypothetical protein
MLPQQDYFTRIADPLNASDLQMVASRAFSQSFRRDLSWSGFSLITFDHAISSTGLRGLMLGLKDELAQRWFAETGRHLVYRSLARFDQQVTTKFHQDGSPREAILMLGYEPTEVTSSLAMADLARVAHGHGLSPQDYLDRFNPMLKVHESRLEKYITKLACFDVSKSHLLLINNSTLPFTEAIANLCGVFHQATILAPDATKSRIINSIMLTVAENLTEETVTRDDLAKFLITTTVAGKPTPYE